MVLNIQLKIGVWLQRSESNLFTESSFIKLLILKNANDSISTTYV
jgi:hypothetical protein